MKACPSATSVFFFFVITIVVFMSSPDLVATASRDVLKRRGRSVMASRKARETTKHEAQRHAIESPRARSTAVASCSKGKGGNSNKRERKLEGCNCGKGYGSCVEYVDEKSSDSFDSTMTTAASTGTTTTSEVTIPISTSETTVKTVGATVTPATTATTREAATTSTTLLPLVDELTDSPVSAPTGAVPEDGAQASGSNESQDIDTDYEPFVPSGSNDMDNTDGQSAVNDEGGIVVVNEIGVDEALPSND